MENSNNKLVKQIFVTGSIVAGSLLGLGSANNVGAKSLFDFTSLGSGAELRTSLLNSSPERNLEMKCGSKTENKADKKAGPNAKEEKSTDKKMDGKAKDGKCGEGKCGDKKMESKAADSKAPEGKCGEGKCGDKKMENKSMKKKEMKESKPAQKQAEPKK